MTADQAVLNENLRCALAAFSCVSPAGERSDADGLSLSYSGEPFGLFNTALPVTPGDFGTRLRRAAEYFGRKKTHWSVWYCEDLLSPEARRSARLDLAMMGLKHVMEAPGMIAHGISAPAGRLPDLEIRGVRDIGTAEDFSDIMSAAFQVPLPMSRRVYASEGLWRGPMKGWVGYSGGEPVSTAAIVVGGGAIGLYAVATHPEHQRRGFGEALVRVALETVRNQTGITTTVLQSSAAGYPLYVRMGYRNVTRFVVYLKE